MLELAIRGARVVDGTGAPAVRADVGVQGGRVVALGSDVGAARRTIDADGQVVAPGFIDVHTHYDAQVMWDPTLAPSSLHGVTTVVGGNCGFTVAPVEEAGRDYVLEMLGCVEGMPADSLRTALTWDWRTFGQWLDRLDGRLALNAGFCVGHSTVRTLVMGEDRYRAATDEEISAMERVVDAALDDGALGFSSSWGDAHRDHLRQPVPSRAAQHAELVRLAARLNGRAGTTLEFIPSTLPRFPEHTIAVMVDMAVAAGRPLNWNVLDVALGATEDDNAVRLSSCDRASARGARMAALSVPMPFAPRVGLTSTLSFNQLPAWAEVLALSERERLAALADGEVRARLAAQWATVEGQLFWNFGPMTVAHVSNPALASAVGRTVGDLAAERGRSVLDVFFDVAVEDRLATYFAAPPGGDDARSWERRAKLWRDPRVLLGGSDAGAHLDSLSLFAFFSDFVGPTVRDRGLVCLEEAVHLVTTAPAAHYGLVGRGRVALGGFADLVVFDPATIGPGPVTVRDDLPGGHPRLFAAASGIARVLVNGVEVLVDGVPTGETPGTVLRGGRDTG